MSISRVYQGIEHSLDVILVIALSTTRRETDDQCVPSLLRLWGKKSHPTEKERLPVRLFVFSVGIPENRATVPALLGLEISSVDGGGGFA